MGTTSTRRAAARTHIPNNLGQVPGRDPSGIFPPSQANRQLADTALRTTDLLATRQHPAAEAAEEMTPAEAADKERTTRRNEKRRMFIEAMNKRLAEATKRLQELAILMQKGKIAEATDALRAFVADVGTPEPDSNVDGWEALKNMAKAMGSAQGSATVSVLRVPTSIESIRVLSPAIEFVRAWGGTKDHSREALTKALRQIIIPECERSNPDFIDEDLMSGHMPGADSLREQERKRHETDDEDRTPSNFAGFVFLTAVTDDGKRLRFVLEKQDKNGAFILAADQDDAETKKFLEPLETERVKKRDSERLARRTPAAGQPVIPAQGPGLATRILRWFWEK